MAHRVDAGNRGPQRASREQLLLRAPLEFIAEDHFREREICAEIDKIAAAPSYSTADLDQILTFLKETLPLHLRDEEEDLFPLLRRRCAADEEIDQVIDRMLGSHGQASAAIEKVVAVLEAHRDSGAPLAKAARAELTHFAEHARRHLIVENAIILPIARGSLTASDLKSLSLRMQQRRGLLPRAKESEAD